MGLAEAIEAAVANRNFGKATAAKRGRDPLWPYVPIVDHGNGHTEQIRGKAFMTRSEAVEHAAKVIAHRRAAIRQRLFDPRCRALRIQCGLPSEI
jgi:hypothetical protein